MNEKIILIACFVMTFGYIGYRTSSLIRGILDRYRSKIDKDISESERLKLSAINLFDESREKLDTIDGEFEKIKIENNKRRYLMQKNFDNKLDKIISKMTNDVKDKIASNNDEIVLGVKQNILSAINETLLEYLDKINEKERDEIAKRMILGVDFKKMFK